MKLHIGCGDTKKKDYVNVDIRSTIATDIVCDVSNMPFSDNEFDEVYSHHSFEHFDFLPAVKELARVSANKAIWHVTVPYATSTKYNLINPYHKELFTEDKFRFFDDLYPREMPQDFKIKTLDVEFYYNFDIWGGERVFDEIKWVELRQKYLNVVEQITFKLQVIK